MNFLNEHHMLNGCSHIQYQHLCLNHEEKWCLLLDMPQIPNKTLCCILNGSKFAISCIWSVQAIHTDVRFRKRSLTKAALVRLLDKKWYPVKVFAHLSVVIFRPNSSIWRKLSGIWSKILNKKKPSFDL